MRKSPDHPRVVGFYVSLSRSVAQTYNASIISFPQAARHTARLRLLGPSQAIERQNDRRWSWRRIVWKTTAPGVMAIVFQGETYNACTILYNLMKQFYPTPPSSRHPLVPLAGHLHPLPTPPTWDIPSYTNSCTQYPFGSSARRNAL